MRTLTLLLILAYAATCIVAGLSGIFAAPAEMHLLYHFDPRTVPGLETADLMSQFGFIKAMELGLGLFIIARLGPILEGGGERRLFAFIVFAGLLARVIAWLRHGEPSTLFLVFLVVEAVLLLCLLIGGRSEDAA